MADPAALGLVSTDFAWWIVQHVLLSQILNGAIPTLGRDMPLPKAIAAYHSCVKQDVVTSLQRQSEQK
jgi:hypothetical protein